MEGRVGSMQTIAAVFFSRLCFLEVETLDVSSIASTEMRDREKEIERERERDRQRQKQRERERERERKRKRKRENNEAHECMTVVW